MFFNFKELDIGHRYLAEVLCIPAGLELQYMIRRLLRQEAELQSMDTVLHSNFDREPVAIHAQQTDCSATIALFCGSTYSSLLCSVIIESVDSTSRDEPDSP